MTRAARLGLYLRLLTLGTLLLAVPSQSSAEAIDWLPFPDEWADTSTSGTLMSPDLTVDVLVTIQKGSFNTFINSPSAFAYTITDPAWTFDNDDLSALVVAGEGGSGCEFLISFDFTNPGGLPAGGSLVVTDLEADSTVQVLSFLDSNPVPVNWNVAFLELNNNQVDFPTWDSSTSTLTGPGTGSPVTETLVFLTSDRQLDRVDFVAIHPSCPDGIGYNAAVQSVTLCGDGRIGAGEQCDDGNTANGDCCSSTCQYESLGSSCDDGNPSTPVDTCDGAGVCVPTLTQWGIFGMALVMLGGVLYLRRRRPVA